MEEMEEVPLESNNPFSDDSAPKANSINPWIPCNADNILDCSSLQRIKSALEETKDVEQYSKSLLLNDFFHLKYEHHVNTDNNQFDIVFKHLTQDNEKKCDLTQCVFIDRHFQDRVLYDTVSNYTTDILSRIHSYFIHSYDISRLKPDDLTHIENRLNESKQSEYKQLDDDQVNDDDIGQKLDNIKLKLISTIIKEKQTLSAPITQSILCKEKYSETYHYFNYDEYDGKQIESITKPLVSNNAYTGKQNEDIQQFTMITSADSSIAQTFLKALHWDISTAVDRFFLYNGDASRLPAPQNEAKEDEGKDEEKEMKPSSDSAEIYNLGIEFYFWKSMDNDALYIEAKYSHLKEEIMENDDIKCTQKQWDRLHEECGCLMSTNHIKKMISNGNQAYIYTIAPGDILSMDHMYAMRLYTSYRSWCRVLCQAFRVGKDEVIAGLKGKIQLFAHWGKLLTESVQCYGDMANDNVSFYRIINGTFKFSKFFGRINVPISTTKDFELCQQLVENGGIIMELSQYYKDPHSKSVQYFDCSGISCFDIEEESVFFGGDILQIKTLYHHMDDEWVNYGYYIEAIQTLIRLMNGLKINKNSLSTNGRIMLKNILCHILRTSNYKIANLPQYISDLLNHLLSHMRDSISFYFADIMDTSQYDFLSEILFKKGGDNDNDNVNINICNICNLFKKCKHVCVLMPDDYIMNDAFCISLIEDLQNIANDIHLIFEWQHPMPLNNHSILDQYRRELSSINWELQFNQKRIKLTSIAQFFDKNEIAQQAEIWQKFNKKLNRKTHIFDCTEDKIPLLVHGYIRAYCAGLVIPLDIIKLTVAMYGDYHTMYWNIHGVEFWNIINDEDDDNDDEEEGLCSDIYSINILDHTMKFQLKLKKDARVGDDRALILSLNGVAEMNKKQAVTISLTMVCEETQCEYRHMSVIGEGEGAEWFDDFLQISEIKALNRAKGIREINFSCNMEVLHIWSFHEDDEDDIEQMRIYHSQSQMSHNVEYEWVLNRDIIPSNVTKEYTMWYSPRFDIKNWCAVFVEREDEFLVALKLLSLPFGIGVLLVRCTITVHNKAMDRFVKDTIIETFKYGDDDKNMGETKEWAKEDLFGANWLDEFSVSKLIVDIKVEIVHLEGINEEQIFRINWPLYGIVCDEETKFKRNDFVLTKEQFETETFGFNYMIGVLHNKIDDLKGEIDRLKQDQIEKKQNDSYHDVINNNETNDVAIEEVKEWLSSTVQLPKYWDLFIQNGFNSLSMIKEINDKSDLKYIGIQMKAHQIKLMNKIDVLKQQEMH